MHDTGMWTVYMAINAMIESGLESSKFSSAMSFLHDQSKKVGELERWHKIMNVTQADEDNGPTPLALVKHGASAWAAADDDSDSKAGMLPISYAFTLGHETIAALLRDPSQPQIPGTPQPPNVMRVKGMQVADALFSSPAKLSVSAMSETLSKLGLHGLYPLQERDDQHRNLLMTACQHGSVAGVKALTETCVSQSMIEVCTCLCADEHSELDLSSGHWFELSQNGDHTAKDIRGRTALVHAAAAASPACLELLLQRDGAEQNARADSGKGDISSPIVSAMSMCQRLDIFGIVIHGNMFISVLISTCFHAGALAAAFGITEPATSGTQQLSQSGHLTPKRIACVHLLLKAKCGMSAAQYANLKDAVRGNPQLLAKYAKVRTLRLPLRKCQPDASDACA
ncbi:hypothetical protein MMC07_000386 [Pseudocyphellaria aurata]|nr:hypothetical protein [Pseudocyphellaria aurata]